MEENAGKESPKGIIPYLHMQCPQDIGETNWHIFESLGPKWELQKQISEQGCTTKQFVQVTTKMITS